MSLTDRINGAARKLPPWAVYLAGSVPLPLYFWMAASGRLGVEPINALEREYGALALKLLVAGLCVTPLRRHIGINLLKFRRALGLLAFVYVTAHLAVWAVLDVQSPGRIWSDILKRPYVTVGMTAFVLLIPLAASSNALSVRRLGPRWRVLHRLVYPAALLAALHFIWLSKGFQIEPLAYFGAICLLLALRMRIRPRLRRA